MKRSKSWLNSRLESIVKASADVITFSLCYKSFFNLNDKPQLIIPITIWMIISYIIGRYDNILRIDLRSQLIIYIRVTLLIQILIILEYIFRQNEINIISRDYIFMIALISVIEISISIISNIVNKKIRNTKTYMLGNTKSINRLKEEILISRKQIYIENLNNECEKNLNQKFKYEVIIDKNIGKEQENIYSYLIKKNIKSKNIIKWSENTLQRIPIYFLDEHIKNEYFETHHRNIKIELVIKRLADILLSCILLILFLPIFIIYCVIIFIQNDGGIFYIQERNGVDSKPFKLIKLRTMIKNAEENRAVWSTTEDKRITRIGKYLRIFRIDEVPQLINVLRGEMSLIGPRPEREVIEKKIITELKYYHLRHRIKPGLSGWAQVNFPYGASIKDTEVKLSYDLYYLKNFSIFLDLLIFLKTIRLVSTGQGAIANKSNV